MRFPARRAPVAKDDFDLRKIREVIEIIFPETVARVLKVPINDSVVPDSDHNIVLLYVYEREAISVTHAYDRLHKPVWIIPMECA